MIDSPDRDGPLLSVIIPYYNTSATVGRTLESVRSQTYRDIEIVLVDDRSPEPFPLDRGGIVFIQHDTNRGLFQTRITGLEHSHGEYVAFLDSDDFVSKDFYRTLVQAAVDEDLDIAAGDTVFDKDGLCDVKNLHEANFGDRRLSGDNVKNAFFGQQGTSFVWHTIWNKVYRRSLWERCLPEFRKVTERIGMLEDFMFSSVLFHKAESFRYVHNEGYHYCTNSASITAGSRDEDRYASNVRSICTVFDHVQSYLDHNEDDPRILNDFDEIRKLYSRMYRNTLENVHGFSSRKRELEKLVDGMMPGYNEVYSPRDRLFEDPRTVYDRTFEDIKQLIVDAETVSFDVFDTLILRPFLDNDDIFTLMGYDPEISGLFGNVSFKDIRVMAENTLRERWGRIGRKGTEDFKLTDIYRFMSELTRIPMSDLVPVMHKELDLEVRHIRPRRSVVELFRLAKYLGKKTVLTSDMYLEHDHMARILDACGITGYDRLLVSSETGHTKYTGNLFKDLISYAGTDPKKIVHLGDSWSKDFENARSAGIVAVYVPRTVDVMDGKVQNVRTNDLGRLGELSTLAFVDGKCLKRSFGYGCMLKTVADRLFDHPYPSYDPSSDFNVSAEAMGYYPVGMHLLGIAEWIRRNTRGRKVVFLGRDGHLPKKAFDMLTGSTDSGYVACSRMALMPFSVSGPVDLLSLPIEPKAHSERSLTGMLDFCVESDGKPLSDDRFSSDGEYLDFVKGRLMGRFSKDRLERSRDLVRRYYRSRIPEGSYVFDMGYSGRLAYALKAALGYDVTFLYVYRNTEAEVYGDVHGLDIRTMYPYEPFVSGFLREFLLSEPGNRCIGFEEKGGEPVPILVSAPRTKLTSYAVDEVQGYALEFVGDYLRRYRDVPPAFSFDPVSVSLPFETMLSSMKESDRRLFTDSFEDDTVYGGKEEVSVHDLLTYSVEEKGCSVLEGKQRGPCPMVHTAHRGRDPFRSKYVNWAYYKAMAFGRLMRKKFRI